MTSHKCESFSKVIFRRNYLQFGLWHVLDEQSKDKLCDVLLNNFKPCRFAPRVKNETEQAYHKDIPSVCMTKDISMQMQI